MKKPAYLLQRCDPQLVVDLCYAYHGYKSAGSIFTYAFGVFEKGKIVAGYLWSPPAPGAAKSVCPECPQGVLALSRMVAVPKDLRELNHVSKPLRKQMRTEIDRGRWPVLITYSDSSLGHSGHVYKCSGWSKTSSARRAIYLTQSGSRKSPYRNGVMNKNGLERSGYTTIQRWEHWACLPGKVVQHMQVSGWVREPIPGKRWRSGNPAFRYVKTKEEA